MEKKDESGNAKPKQYFADPNISRLLSAAALSQSKEAFPTDPAAFTMNGFTFEDVQITNFCLSDLMLCLGNENIQSAAGTEASDVVGSKSPNSAKKFKAG